MIKLYGDVSTLGIDWCGISGYKNHLHTTRADGTHLKQDGNDITMKIPNKKLHYK